MSKGRKEGSKETTSGQFFSNVGKSRKKFDPKRNLTDFNYLLGSATLAADYISTMKFIFNFLRKALFIVIILEYP
jgi:hypothetical protein